MKPLINASLLAVAVFISGCDSKWEQMTDEQLVAKTSECMSIADPSSAMIQVCKNYARECERRRGLGVYVC